MPENTLKKRKAQSRRVRALRAILDLSRPKFASKHPRLSKSNIRNWEEGDKSGLTDTGAQCLAEAALGLGVKVSEEWLMDGTGEGPVKIAVPNLPRNENLSLDNAVSTLCSQFPRTLSILVKNDELAPELNHGDFALGERTSNDDFTDAIDELCIIETIEGEVLLGVLKQLDDDKFTLQPKKEALNILSVAPVSFILHKH
jgi:hypothetical protein